LQKHATNYPDGAVFAKVGVGTRDDPDFTSSAVPSGATRFQLMVMDHRKNAATHGWGYALFGDNGLTLDGDPKRMTEACNACHELVPKRGYVFSEPVNLTIAQSLPEKTEAESRSSFDYHTVARGACPQRFQTGFPHAFQPCCNCVGHSATKCLSAPLTKCVRRSPKRRLEAICQSY
jgi:hypothetical protein